MGTERVLAVDADRPPISGDFDVADVVGHACWIPQRRYPADIRRLRSTAPSLVRWLLMGGCRYSIGRCEVDPLIGAAAGRDGDLCHA